MRRRSFMITLLLALTGLGAFSLIRWFHGSDQNKTLARPKFLSRLCDETTIQKLGEIYLKLRPDKVNTTSLLNDLLGKEASKILSNKVELSNIDSQIEKKIIHDFDCSNVILLQGWVLSVTEARQCALFSILNK